MTFITQSDLIQTAHLGLPHHIHERIQNFTGNPRVRYAMQQKAKFRLQEKERFRLREEEMFSSDVNINVVREILSVQDHITPDKLDELKREVLTEIDCLLEKWKLAIVKCPHINEQDLNERIKYLKKVVNNVEPHGEAVFIGLLLCGTP